MGLVWRRRVALTRSLWLNLTISSRGPRISLSARRGPVTVNSGGGLWVRLGRGLTYRNGPSR